MSRALRTAHLMLALLVLTQAALAGSFLAGSAQARFIHMVVGSTLPFIALGVCIAAWISSARGRSERRLAAWSSLLPVLIWVESALGHMPMPLTTAIHVPLGVAIFGLLLMLGHRRKTVPHQ